MDIRPLSETYAVSPQIDPQDITALAEAGFRSIMCNRPDGEDPAQPDFATIAAAAEAKGLVARWIPVTGGPTPETLDAFRAALDEMPGPMLAYCRSGTRCTILWTITQYGRMTDDDIVKATQAAGYDMSPLIAQLQHMRS